MDELDAKMLKYFPGKVVRKDLTNITKKGANVPTYVLEYLLGMYCATEDQDAIDAGLKKIKRVLSENYVRPDLSEYVKSKIKENGSYTIIDKITVTLDEVEDKYIAYFTNLDMRPFEVSSDLVVHNEKLLVGGVWCIIRIEYNGQNVDEEDDEYGVDIFDNKKGKKKKKKQKKSKYSKTFGISSLKPIQMPNLNMEEFLSCRNFFTKHEWIGLLLRSVGYNPEQLNQKQKMHFLLRMVPFVQKNYNLVELGPRGTGKSHVYSEVSPYSILISSGHTTVANMFYNMSSHQIGLVGNWDAIAFDEVSGMTSSTNDMIQIMKNYMANGSFARGTESINADASIVLEGNTFRSVSDMMRTTNLFEPFPDEFNNDSAFFDRIHAYLPGWETPKLKSSHFTNSFGLISDCLAEFCHAMRKYDFTNSFSEYYELNDSYNTRDDTAVRRTFSGLAKLIYPDEKMSKEDVRELLEYSIECRKRVKEQLRKINPAEFSDTSLGYIDLENNEEYIVELPEVSGNSLIYDGFEKAGYVYTIGKSIDDKLGVYRLENKLLSGTGRFDFKNVEGLPSRAKSVKESFIAAFNYFTENIYKFVNVSYSEYDYSLYYNDLQNRNVSDEVSVAEVVGLFSAISKIPVSSSSVIVGKVVMSGSMMPITTDLEEIFVTAANAGAKKIFIPEETMPKYMKLPFDLRNEMEVVFYNSPIDATKKALRNN